MRYNDFPILNDNEYKFLNEQFNNSSFNKKEILTKICFELNTIINFNFTNKEKFNNKIKQEIFNGIEIANKWLNNFSSQFNISLKSTTNIVNINIFSLLKKFNTVIYQLTTLIKHESKEYYKSLAINCINEIISTSSNILQALNESNLILFKYM